jgi:GT2 family glycosyltransferase
MAERGLIGRHRRAMVRIRSPLVPAVDERMIPDATIVIVTHNRRDEALRAVASAVAQTAAVEVLVLDDGSSDGTTEAILRKYPEARVERFEEPAEITSRRNLAGELARAPILVVIDDDAELTSPTIVEHTLREFNHKRVGAVAIPYVDVPVSDDVLQLAPDGDVIWVTNQFRATAYAIRRDVFLAVGGYRALLVHQAEEPDLCIRLLRAGYVVRLGRSEPITHHGSPRRNLERVWFLGTRNDVLFTWYYVPRRYLLPRLAKVTAHLLWLGIRVRRPGLFVRAIFAGYRAAFAERRRREPVRPALYRTFRRLGFAPEPIEAVEPVLPALREPSRTPEHIRA